jgi:diketogulonate reductase-like aldo/keto reductase
MLAKEKGASASQLAIAWVLAKSNTIVALIGARTRAQRIESLGALRPTLTAEDVRGIEETLPCSRHALRRTSDANPRQRAMIAPAANRAIGHQLTVRRQGA